MSLFELKRCFAAGAGALIALAIVACDKQATPDQCQAALAHYVELSIRVDPALSDLDPAELEAAKNVKEAIVRTEPAFVRASERCASEARASQVSCALEASDANAWEACML